MEEFIKNKKKVLKIDNPISIFTSFLSIGSENVIIKESRVIIQKIIYFNVVFREQKNGKV